MIKDLKFVAPEDVGVSSKNVLKFIEIMEYNKINVHSFLMAKDGKIFSEGYVSPFDENFMHRIYSSSKTIVSLAVGKLITEGKLHYADKISDIFSDMIDVELDDYTKEATVFDALTMSQPSVPNGIPKSGKENDRWMYNRLNRTIGKRPSGTIFTYAGGADTLAVVVEKITGKTFLEYLRPEFDKIGVSKDIWCVKAPDGFAWGGSGVICTLRDFAAIGEFMMNKGCVNGEQLIESEYIEKATSMQIVNFMSNTYSPLKTCGYGFLTWITPEGFAFRGMGCELIFCFPKKNLLFACQADTQPGDATHSEILYQAFKFLIYDNVSEKMPASQDFVILQNKLKNLKFPTHGNAHADFEKEINGITYTLDENSMGWKYFRFDFNGEEGALIYENARGVKRIRFGCGWRLKSTFPETHYYDKKKDEPANRELDSLTIAEWTGEKTLLLRAYIIDTSFGNLFITFSFKGEQVGVYASKRAEFFLEDYEGIFGGRRKNKA